MIARFLRGLLRGDRSQSGATAAELGLLLPVLITVLVGVAEFGRLLWTKSLIDHAVNEAARCAAVNTATCGTTSAIQSYAVAKSAPLTLSTSVFTASTPSCGKQVSATYAFSFLAATLLPYTVTLQSQACFPA